MALSRNGNRTKTLRAYNSEDSTIDKFVDYNEKTATAYYKSEYYGSMTGPSINFVNNLSLSLISVFGAIMYLYRTISLGDIASFVLYSRKFSGPINEMANIATDCSQHWLLLKGSFDC